MERIQPVVKPIKSHSYCYFRHLCDVCGAIHWYRKTQIRDGAFFDCAPVQQMGFLPEDKTYQQSLFEKGGERT